MSEQEEIDIWVARLKCQAEEASKKIMAGSFIRPELFETLRLSVVLPVVRLAIVQARADAMMRAADIADTDTFLRGRILNESRGVIKQMSEDLETEYSIRNVTGLS